MTRTITLSPDRMERLTDILETAWGKGYADHGDGTAAEWWAGWNWTAYRVLPEGKRRMVIFHNDAERVTTYEAAS